MSDPAFCGSCGNRAERADDCDCCGASGGCTCETCTCDCAAEAPCEDTCPFCHGSDFCEDAGISSCRACHSLPPLLF